MVAAPAKNSMLNNPPNGRQFQNALGGFPLGAGARVPLTAMAGKSVQVPGVAFDLCAAPGGAYLKAKALAPATLETKYWSLHGGYMRPRNNKAQPLMLG